MAGKVIKPFSFCFSPKFGEPYSHFDLMFQFTKAY